MTDKQENIQSMHYAVKKINEENQSVVSTVAALQTSSNNLNEKIIEIDNLKEIQLLVSKGYTEDKAFKKVKMVDLGVIIIGAASAYARVAKNLPLLENINYSRSDLLYARDQDSYSKCESVVNEVEPIIGSLGDYGIKPEQMDDFKDKINNFKDVVQNPRAAIVEGKSATEQLVDKFKEAKEILVIMDSIVKQFKTTQVNYYNSYFAAREIIDLGVRHNEKPPVPPTP